MIALGAGNAGERSFPRNAAPHEFGNEPGVADRFQAAFDVELREEVVVDEAVLLARFDGPANGAPVTGSCITLQERLRRRAADGRYSSSPP